MRAIAKKSSLIRALFLASFATESATISNVLRSLLLEAKDDNLVISSSGYTCSVMATLPAHVEERGAFAVSAKTITDLIKYSPDESEVELSLNPSSSRLNIVGPSFRARIPGMSADDWSQESTFSLEKPKMMSRLEAKEFSRAIKSVSFSAAESKKGAAFPILTGIKLEPVSDDEIIFMTADGFRAGVARIEAEPAPSQTAVLPLNLMSLLADQVKDDDDISFGLVESLAYFNFVSKPLDVWFRSSTLAGEYPDMSAKLRDVPAKGFVVCDRRELATGIAQVISVVGGFSNFVSLNLEYDKLTAEGLSTNGEAKVALSAHQYEGECSMLLSGKLLSLGLDSVQALLVKLIFPEDASDPLRLVPEDGFQFSHFLMPAYKPSQS